MKSVNTQIQIDACAQTIWSILDDLSNYSLWNKVLPEFSGVTTVGRQVTGQIHFSGKPPQQVLGTLILIVGARELRWVSELPSEPVTRAEHYFKLTPIDDGRTLLEHGEFFDGPLEDFIWTMIADVIGADYDQMNHDLKARAEALRWATPLLHPAIEAKQRLVAPSADVFLRCKCTEATIEARIDGPIFHTHLCGCSQCWKPDKALFALIAMSPAGSVEITRHPEKLEVVDPSTAIRRQACAECGVHVLGTVAEPDHHFFGLEFVHPELIEGPSQKPEFAGFVSSVIETGASPSEMNAVRRKLQALGIPAYDVFSPELMDLISWHRVKIRAAR